MTLEGAARGEEADRAWRVFNPPGQLPLTGGSGLPILLIMKDRPHVSMPGAGVTRG